MIRRIRWTAATALMIVAGWLVCGRNGPATLRRLIWAGYDAEQAKRNSEAVTGHG